MIRPYGAALTPDYPRYTAGVAMLETAERFTPEDESRRCAQFLLLVGGLRALGETARDPRLVLDAYLLRSLSVAGYAPALEECARCGTRGPRRRFAIPAGGVVCGPAGRTGRRRPARGPWP